MATTSEQAKVAQKSGISSFIGAFTRNLVPGNVITRGRVAAKQFSMKSICKLIVLKKLHRGRIKLTHYRNKLMYQQCPKQ